jgi:hypothetical protein
VPVNHQPTLAMVAASTMCLEGLQDPLQWRVEPVKDQLTLAMVSWTVYLEGPQDFHQLKVQAMKNQLMLAMPVRQCCQKGPQGPHQLKVEPVEDQLILAMVAVWRGHLMLGMVGGGTVYLEGSRNPRQLQRLHYWRLPSQSPPPS